MVKMHNAKLTEIERAAREALRNDVAKPILKRARELAPSDEGDLRKSGKIAVDDKTVTVAFRAKHAWLQHERLDYEHPNGGQAKYLETAVQEIASPATVLAGVQARLK